MERRRWPSVPDAVRIMGSLGILFAALGCEAAPEAKGPLFGAAFGQPSAEQLPIGSEGGRWGEFEYSQRGESSPQEKGAGSDAIEPEVKSVFARTVDIIADDFRHFYSLKTLKTYLWAFIPAAVLANTEWDEDIQDEYRDRVWGSDYPQGDLDRFADNIEEFGDHWKLIPIYGGLALLSELTGEWEPLDTAGEFGSRSLRAIMVGAPWIFVTQRLTGATRPRDPDPSSRWRPLEDSHGVSGHAFIGSIPFLTAAEMVGESWVRYPLIAASALPAWARLHQDDHFLSQIVLGWLTGFLATQAVSQTNEGFRRWDVSPVLEEGRSGLSLNISF